MNQQVLLDKLSEFLMVEQGGFQLYTVLAERTQLPELRARYEEFGMETSRHREILASMIAKLGGDPGYVSPLARVAQIRGDQLLNVMLLADSLSPDEIEAVGLDSVLLAESKDHADWQLLSQLIQNIPEGPDKASMVAAVEEVEAQEDTHLGWASEQAANLAVRMLVQDPEPSVARWELNWTGPHYDESHHPAPMQSEDGLLPAAGEPNWGPSPIERSLAGTQRAQL